MAYRREYITHHFSTITYRDVGIRKVIEPLSSTNQIKNVFKGHAYQNCHFKPLASLYSYQVDDENE